MRDFLTSKAKELAPSIFDDDWPDVVKYSESLNPAAIDGDRWLEEGTSYIWKVSVLAAWDSNKFDHARVFIGHQRGPHFSPEFIGMLHWHDGENDDIGRCLRRYVELLDTMHPVFADD